MSEVDVKLKTPFDGSGLFAEPLAVRSQGADGVQYLSSGYELPQVARCLGEWLVHWVEKRPEKTFLAERSGEGWREVSYSHFLNEVELKAGWLLEAGASAERPVAILSDNSVNHAIMAFAAIHVGIPVATISAAYSLMSADHAKLKSMIALLDPAVIYVEDTVQYGKALAAISNTHNATTVATKLEQTNAYDAVQFDLAGNDEQRQVVAERFAEITPETTARLLFTSGSTGTPKAVINTHQMLTSNQEAKRVTWPFLADRPPRIVDWLPWSHTFGCNFTTNMVLRNGGSLFIDDGKPAPPLVHKTVANIKDVRPNMLFNVPRGYDMLAGPLEQDEGFRNAFFGAELIFYAAAALPQSVWEKLIGLSLQVRAEPVPLVSAWGSTETAPLATDCYFQAETSGNIGLPIPGTTLKLVPNGDKLEVRVKGPNVTPGYFRLDEITEEAFDEEGFYSTGDAVRFADPQYPEKGLYFDGRVSEDFKLSSGTWVSVGALRIAGIDALSPLAQDIVVAGHNRNEVGFLIFPNAAACRTVAGSGDDAPLSEVIEHPAVRQKFTDGLTEMKTAAGGSSRHAARARLLAIPPNPDAGEITDKAYLNQQQILINRVADVERLFGDNEDDRILAG
ncbi:MAG: feruloyl-CoA synthase [Rhizobiaceae bacterium]